MYTLQKMQLKILGLQGAKSIDTVRIATAKMSTEDLIAVLAKSKLTREQQIELLQDRGLTTVRATMIASANTMASSDLYAALTKYDLSASIAEESLATSGLTTEQIAAVVSASNLTAADLAQILARTTLTKEEQIAILVKKGLSAAEAESTVAQFSSITVTAAATAITKLYTNAIVMAKGAVLALGKAILANPWILIGTAIVGAIVGAIALFDSFSKSAINASQKFREAAESSLQEAKKVEEEQKQINDLIKEYEELAKADNISADARLRIRDIQKEINTLVGGEVGNLDLVNGGLEEQLKKLKEIQLEKLKAENPDIVAAYSDAKKNADNAYYRDYSEAGFNFLADWAGWDLYVDGNDKKAIDILNGIDGVSAISDWNFGDTTDIKFNAKGAQERYDLITQAIEALEQDPNYDHYNSAVYNALVAQRKKYANDLAMLNEGVASMANKAIQTESLQLDIDGFDVDSVDSYNAYREELVKRILENSDIEHMIGEGTLTDAQLQTLVDDMMAKLFPTIYNEINKNNGNSIDPAERIKKMVEAFTNEMALIKKAVDEFNATGEVSEETYNALIASNEDYADIFTFTKGKIQLVEEETQNLVDDLLEENSAAVLAAGGTKEHVAALAEQANGIKDSIKSTSQLIDEIRDFNDIIHNMATGTEYSTLEIIEMLEQYPELISALKQTANGYIFETSVLEELIKVRIKNLKLQAVEKGLSEDVLKIYDELMTNISTGTLKNGVTETFDFIEIYIDRIETALEKVENRADSTFSKMSDRAEDYVNAISETGGMIATQNSAARKYLQLANGVGLSEGIKRMVREGSINISGYDADTIDLISAYEDYYEKYLDATSTVEELQEQQKEFYTELFDLYQTDYENKISLIDSEMSILEKQIDIDEDKGVSALSEYYTKLIAYEKQRMSELQNEYGTLEHQFNKAIQEGKIEEYSEAWYSMKEEIAGVNEEIMESTANINEYKNSVKDLVEDAIESQCDALSDLVDEYKDALDSAKDLYDYQTKVSEKTSDIAVLQKKIIAYENDNSEETKAQLQKLKVELEKAQEDLQETEYDKFISDQKDLLDGLYDGYETMMNARIDEIANYLIDSNATLSSLDGSLQAILRNLNITHYATGGLNTRTGLAWLDGTSSKPELVLNSQDTANFLALRDLLSSMDNNEISIRGLIGVGDTNSYITAPDLASKITTVSGGVKNSGSTIVTVNIPIDKVQDYNDFIEQLRKDPKAERIIQSMTIDRINGGSPLDKYKVKI